MHGDARESIASLFCVSCFNAPFLHHVSCTGETITTNSSLNTAASKGSEVHVSKAGSENAGDQMPHPGGGERRFGPKVPGTCNLVVKGLPLVGSQQQQCCKVSAMKQYRNTPAQQGTPTEGRLAATTPVTVGSNGKGSDVDEHGSSGVVPVVSKGEGGSGAEEEMVCLPSFIIAGTQKCGTTALTGG